MDTTSESDKKMIPPNSADPQSIDDVESGHVGGSAPPPIDNGDSGHEGGSARLKRGHWTSAEDAILVDYVLKHGEGKWNNIQKDSVLARCGKSCRLRWINHLRPDLKKGEFTLAEERKVVELHAMMGNKWSLMAPELPGRTDNEIKNFWNTRVRRHERLGLPLYPPGIIPQSLNENQQNDDTIAFSSGDPYRPDFFPDNNSYIPVLDFKSPEHDQPLFPPSLLDISASSLPSQIQNVYDHGLTSDLASSSSMFLGSHELPSIQTQTSSFGMVQIPPTECTQPCDLAVDDDEFLEALLNDSRSMTNMENSYLQQNSHAFDMATDGGDILEVVLAESKDMNNMKNYYDPQNSHAPDMATDDCDFLKAILNESRSLNIMKNNSHQQNSHASEMATDDSDYLGAVLHESRRLNNIQNNYHAQNTHASDMATDDSDLLEAVLHESKSINNRKNNYQQQNSHASDVALDEMDIFARDSHETNWEDRSPFGGYSLDEEPLSISDYLLDSNSFDHMDTNKDHAWFGDANGALFSDDDLRRS